MKAILFCFSLLLTSFFTSANQPPLEAYGALPNKSMMVISPSGDRIAYRTTSAENDYMVVYSLTDNKLVSAVDVSEVKPTSLYFISETKLILVVEENRKLWGYKGRHDYSAAFVYNTEDKKIFQLMSAGYGIYGGQTALGRILAISDDGKYAYMPAWLDSGRYSLFRVNLKKKRKPQVVNKGKSDARDFFIEPDGTILARERYNDEKDLHRVESYISGEWKTIYQEVTPELTKGIEGLTPDKKHLVVKSFDAKIGRWGYFKMSLTTGELSEPLFIREDADVEYLVKDVNRIVHGVAYSGLHPSYEFFDDKLTKQFKNIALAMPNNGFYLRNYTPDWSSILFRFEGEGTPGDYYKFTKGGFNFLASSRDNIAPEQVHPMVVKNIKARDGITIPTIITTPLGTSGKKLPTIMLPHGGPEAYDRLAFDWQAQYFASQGYLVIQPQFRGSSGFGIGHVMLGEGQWGLKMQDDLTDTLMAMVNEGYADPSRVCIVGSSYGGYAALAGVTYEPDLYQCAVSINGVADVNMMLKDDKKAYGAESSTYAYWQRVSTKGNMDDKHLEKISPINHVDNINVPVLLVHGERDSIVPLKQSEEMYEKLIDARKPAELVVLDEGDHYLSTYKNRLEAWRKVDSFIKKHL